MKHWRALEDFLVPAAVTTAWRSQLGEDFESFRSAFLQRTSDLVRFYPCSRGCGCAHEIIEFGPDDLVATCRCGERSCADFKLVRQDLAVWQLSWPKLAGELCQALGLRSKPVDLKLGHTYQIGSWGSEPVPVILTIQHSTCGFREVLTALVARLRGPFALLAPTANHLDAIGQELLASVSAGFVALDGQVRLSPSGGLQANSNPGELFLRFVQPDREAVDEDVARHAFALVQQLDSEQALKPPTALTVFRLYCVEDLSAGQIARRCGGSKATVIRRLEQIRRRTGLDPRALRRVSSHLEKIQDDLRDSRAAHIHPRRLLDDAFEEES